MLYDEPSVGRFDSLHDEADRARRLLARLPEHVRPAVAAENARRLWFAGRGGTAA